MVNNISALSWNIATEPRLYRELAVNPHSPHALKVISERFPDTNSDEVIKAVILAEPEGLYDRNFNKLSKDEQKIELGKQVDITVVNKKLVLYFRQHLTEIGSISKALLYKKLSKIVFGTNDIKEIELKYSQSQRKDFRLLIVNFIEDIQGFESHYRQKSKSSRQLLLRRIFTLLSIVIIFYVGAKRIQNKGTQIPQAKEQVLALESQKETVGLPVRIRIPSIEVDSAIESVGVTPTGLMGVPENINDVGWFSLGPRPGEIGSSVIAGHFDGVLGQPAVFADLNKLIPGDKLYVTDNKGNSITFVVDKSQTYLPGYADEVFGSSDGSHLNLVTCDGVWDGPKKGFSKRLVVFTDLAD